MVTVSMAMAQGPASVCASLARTFRVPIISSRHQGSHDFVCLSVNCM
ncbi:hypothetical protein [Bradyrhizobium genosp. P]